MGAAKSDEQQPMNAVLARRRAGVLLHPTSLPGPGETGTLGADALRFVDFLCDGGFTVWQTLPLGPADSHGSPYRLQSTYAGDPRLIDTCRLAQLDELPRGMHFDAVQHAPLEAFRSFCSTASTAQQKRFIAFMQRDRRNLLPYGLFELCRQRFENAPGWEWPAGFRRLRSRQSPDLRALFLSSKEHFRAIAFRQYLFELLWSSLKRYANTRGVYLFGDLPFYVDQNSVEVWWEPHLFRIDANGRPLVVAGVPPDYFNEDGQLWGNPLYDWQALSESNFDWWVRRFTVQLRHFDLLRIDHFRALESYWEVPAGATTAREGHWRKAPGQRLLKRLNEHFGELPVVAEDLGMITDEVRDLRDDFNLPGMAVLQFAFDGLPDNPHAPREHIRNAVVYTGTHDNDTVVGWYRSVDADTKRRIHQGFGRSDLRMPEDLIDAAYASPAQLAVIPLQDLMALGAGARMNKPGTTEGNWRWRFRWEDIDPDVSVAAWQRAQRYERGGVPSQTPVRDASPDASFSSPSYSAS